MSIVVHHIGPTCVQCTQTKRQLDRLGLAYTEVDLRDEPELTERFRIAGHLTAPVVVTETETWSGFRLDKIEALVNRKENNG